MTISQWTSNLALQKWIQEVKDLCKPETIYFCTGAVEEYEAFCQELVANKTFLPLNEKKRPHSYYCCTDPSDVARVEDRTFICSKNESDAGPTNQWEDPLKMKNRLKSLFSGCMKGRTMYVIPFRMGPVGAPSSLIGVQITDSLYVVVNMYLMTRMGNEPLKALGKEGTFVPCLHSVGVPLEKGEKDVIWPSQAENKYIVHFPDEPSIWSFGSGYGGNALLGKKCLALRIASVKARDEKWLAEHMLIIGVTNPEGKKKYFAAAFPSACGKTNLAMLKSDLPGWKVECLGDDIAWMHLDEEGRLYATNPEYGFFGVAVGTSQKSNPHAMSTLAKNTIFTNVALTDDQDVWWEGMTEKPPEHLTDWRGNRWTPLSKTPAAHPNSRFTVRASQCPILDPAFESSKGVPLSGIIFGGRRSHLVPLVAESFSWNHGVFFGASLSSEMTAAAVGTVGRLRHDPFAMLPFCGYNMGDYFSHWIEMGKRFPTQLAPKIFQVNWFLKSDEGKFLWPGFRENMRVLKWIFERCDGSAQGEETPVGILPKKGALDLSDLPKVNEEKLFAIHPTAWKDEVEGLRDYFRLFKGHFPAALTEELNALEKRLDKQLS